MPTITIDMTVQQATRLADAWEELYQVRPDLAGVKAHLVRELKAIVIHGEKQKADREAAAPTPFEPT